MTRSPTLRVESLSSSGRLVRLTSSISSLKFDSVTVIRLAYIPELKVGEEDEASDDQDRYRYDKP